MEAPLIPDEKLKQMYSAMLKCRMLHEHTASVSRSRGAANGLSEIGHEAALVGCAIDLRAEDAIASSHRGLIADFMLNLPFEGASGKSGHKADAKGRAAAMARCAELRTGVAMAKKMKDQNSQGQKLKTGNIVVTFAGITSGSLPSDEPASGNVSSGKSWSDALYVAGKDSLPIIFVQRAANPEVSGEASPHSRSNGASRRRATPGHGVTVIPVDGNDAIAVYRVAHEAIRRARQHGGPTLIECMPYCLEGRQGTGAAASSSEDPIEKMELYLSRKGLFPRGWKGRLRHRFSSEISNGLKLAPDSPRPSMSKR